MIIISIGHTVPIIFPQQLLNNWKNIYCGNKKSGR